ncbi:MAG: hypothetical protein OI74_06195 [Gammaproteobacteria bacterium (ex Lamellibrachia satsuma)]|nr:MAG: hypothetical protein OI74_06195 [Gammaproteobacteria bacterium (ex Lamellibrachia satsuma)]RRS37508.1 MAG: hypothetical protein NV67_01025 [Gammaproteobacteria bacterium (ex Lamellibrachia satsuma)]
MGHAVNFTSHHIFVGRNDFSDNRENAIDIKEINDVVLSQNKMYNFTASSSSAGAAVVIHYGPERIWMLYNEVYNSDLGLVTTESTETWMIGNVIYDIHGSSPDPDSGYSSGAAIHFRGASSGGVVNNTLYDYDTGIQLTAGSDYLVENNIFAGRNLPLGGYDIRIGTSSIADSTDLNYNLFDSANVYWNGTRYNSLDSLKTNELVCQYCLQDTSLDFLDKANNNFKVSDTSQAVDKGNMSIVYSRYKNLYGVDIVADIEGRTRPIGNAIDIGAYETDGVANTNQPPPPPYNVTATKI